MDARLLLEVANELEALVDRRWLTLDESEAEAAQRDDEYDTPITRLANLLLLHVGHGEAAQLRISVTGGRASVDERRDEHWVPMAGLPPSLRTDARPWRQVAWRMKRMAGLSIDWSSCGGEARLIVRPQSESTITTHVLYSQNARGLAAVLTQRESEPEPRADLTTAAEVERLEGEGNAAGGRGDLVAMRRRFEAAVRLARSSGSPRRLRLALCDYAEALVRVFRDEEAASIYEQAWVVATEDPACAPTTLVALLGERASALRRLGRLRECVSLRAQALDIAEARLSAVEPGRLEARAAHLHFALEAGDDPAPMLEPLRAIVATFDDLLGDGHGIYGPRGTLALVERRLGDVASARARLEQSAQAAVALADSNAELAIRVDLAELATASGDHDAAADQLRQALAGLERLGGLEMPFAGEIQRRLASTLSAQGRAREAHAMLEAAARVLDATLPEGHVDRAGVAVELARYRERTGPYR